MEQFTLLLPIDEISNVSEIMIDALLKGDSINLYKAGKEVRICFNSATQQTGQGKNQEYKELLNIY